MTDPTFFVLKYGDADLFLVDDQATTTIIDEALCFFRKQDADRFNERFVARHGWKSTQYMIPNTTPDNETVIAKSLISRVDDVCFASPNKLHDPYPMLVLAVFASAGKRPPGDFHLCRRCGVVYFEESPS